MTRRKWLPDNVTEYKDRHGRPRYRFRKKGLPTYHFKNAPGTTEFLAEYHAAKNAETPVVERFAPYSYDALAASLYQTGRWIKSKDNTQATYRGIIERFRKDNGHKDVRRVTAANIGKKLSKMADTPAAANNLRKALARLHRHAVFLGWRSDNPVEATDAYKAEGDGFHCWTNDELAAFDAKWPYGTRERLAKELLLCSALRKSDVLTIGPQNRREDKLVLHHSKNDSDTVVPMSPALIKALEGFESGSPYVQTVYGKPYTSTGFYNWFKRACVKAGIPHCSPHGLRKAISRLLAESGATVLEGRAVTGHKTDREFMKYAASADKERMAERAMANLAETFAKPAGKNRKNANDSNGQEKTGGGQG